MNEEFDDDLAERFRSLNQLEPPELAIFARSGSRRKIVAAASMCMLALGAIAIVSVPRNSRSSESSPSLSDEDDGAPVTNWTLPPGTAETTPPPAKTAMSAPAVSVAAATTSSSPIATTPSRAPTPAPEATSVPPTTTPSRVTTSPVPTSAPPPSTTISRETTSPAITTTTATSPELARELLATVTPAAAQAGETVVVSPAGEIERFCLSYSELYASANGQLTLVGIVGLPTGYVPVGPETRLTLPPCIGPTTDEPASYTLPSDLAVGDYVICMSISDASCGALTVN